MALNTTANPLMFQMGMFGLRTSINEFQTLIFLKVADPDGGYYCNDVSGKCKQCTKCSDTRYFLKTKITAIFDHYVLMETIKVHLYHQ